MSTCPGWSTKRPSVDRFFTTPKNRANFCIFSVLELFAIVERAVVADDGVAVVVHAAEGWHARARAALKGRQLLPDGLLFEQRSLVEVARCRQWLRRAALVRALIFMKSGYHALFCGPTKLMCFYARVKVSFTYLSHVTVNRQVNHPSPPVTAR